MARGRLISVEGIDGAGKTTLVAGLARARPELLVDDEPDRRDGAADSDVRSGRQRVRNRLTGARRAPGEPRRR